MKYKINDYDVIVSSDLNKLILSVKEKIKEGWVMAGGIDVVFKRQGHTYCQAIELRSYINYES